MNKAAYKLPQKYTAGKIPALVARTERITNVFVCHTYNLYHSKEENTLAS